jgi:hypothetical protein
LKDRRKRDRDLAGAVQASLGLDQDLAGALDRLMGPLMARIHPDPGIGVLDALCRDHPSQHHFRVVRAQALVELDRQSEAAADFAETLALVAENRAPWTTDDRAGAYPAAVADPRVFELLTGLRPRDRTLWIARVRNLGRSRQWPEAAAVATRLNEFDPPDDTAWSHEAVLQSWIGNHEDYRRVCRGMLERFGTRTRPDPARARHVVLSCLLEPDVLSDLGELAPLVSLFSASAPANQHSVSILAAGCFEYRTGGFRAAIERLDPLRAESAPNAAEAEDVLRALGCVLRALAHQKLDQADEARRELTAAEALARRANFDPDRAGPLHASWIEWLRYHVLRREAEGLLHPTAGN